MAIGRLPCDPHADCRLMESQPLTEQAQEFRLARRDLVAGTCLQIDTHCSFFRDAGPHASSMDLLLL